jgi:hypothetical protein
MVLFCVVRQGIECGRTIVRLMETIWEEALTSGDDTDPHTKAAVASFLSKRWQLLLLLRPFFASESDTLAFAAGGMACYLIDARDERDGSISSRLWRFIYNLGSSSISSSSSSSAGSSSGTDLGDFRGDFFQVGVAVSWGLGFRV